MGARYGAPMGPVDWDERYASHGEGLWSGRPNGALVAELVGRPPGRALDVGCGEGADPLWLARAGWEVTGADVSEVALERAGAGAREAGVTVEWVRAKGAVSGARRTPRSLGSLSGRVHGGGEEQGRVVAQLLGALRHKKGPAAHRAAVALEGAQPDREVGRGAQADPLLE